MLAGHHRTLLIGQRDRLVRPGRSESVTHPAGTVDRYASSYPGGRRGGCGHVIHPITSHRQSRPGAESGHDDRVDMQLAERILAEVAAIPRGRVSTYGRIAGRAGSLSPRLAGWVLAQLADDTLPWHRVVRADGRPAPHLAREQLARLAAEGVPAAGGRIDLTRFCDGA